MWEPRHALRSTATPAAVWALWANPARWPDWNGDIARAELDGSFERGSTARIEFRRSGTLRFTITELEHERVFLDEARLPGARMGHEHRIEPKDDGIEISNRLYIDGPAERLYAFALGRRVRRSVRAFVERERSLAEAAAGEEAHR